MSEDWELFASILVRDRGVATKSGLDLARYEVKSATHGSSFEYQYHRNSWQEKLVADRAAGHLFISHEDWLRLVEVRFCEGSALREFFDTWEANVRTRINGNSVSRDRCPLAGCAGTPRSCCALKTARRGTIGAIDGTGGLSLLVLVRRADLVQSPSGVWHNAQTQGRASAN